MDPLESTPGKSALELHLEALKRRTYAELASLPETFTDTVEDLEAPGKEPDRAVLSRDLLPDGSLRIVLQSCQAGFCCGAGVSAIGFLMAPDGTCTAVPDDLMAEFRMDD